MTEFELYTNATYEGLGQGRRLFFAGNPQDHNPHLPQSAQHWGWSNGMLLYQVLAGKMTLPKMQRLVSDTALYWQAHAKGMAAQQCGIPWAENPNTPDGCSSLRPPKQATGEKTMEWQGWQGGWFWAFFLHDTQHSDYHA